MFQAKTNGTALQQVMQCINLPPVRSQASVMSLVRVVLMKKWQCMMVAAVREMEMKITKFQGLIKPQQTRLRLKILRVQHYMGVAIQFFP